MPKTPTTPTTSDRKVSHPLRRLVKPRFGARELTDRDEPDAGASHSVPPPADASPVLAAEPCPTSDTPEAVQQ